ncbi:MAG: DUF5615 family PIN-like protein [Gemmatimonadota bacterium]|nr:DUF5615 family PIN-like protein [Gemmatimonadota bacterium]
MNWLLLDRTLPTAVVAELEGRGVRAIHAADEGLATLDARALLDAAIEDECLLVTRNYADYAALADAYRHAGRTFPGILFVDATGDAPASADAIARWLESSEVGDREGQCAWVSRSPRVEARQST